MKKSLLAAVSLSVLAGTALAADLPTRKQATVAPALTPIWTGFYAGINIGYGFGTNSNSSNSNYALGNNPIAGAPLDWAGLNFGNANGLSLPTSGVGAAQSTGVSVNQSGVVGGGQIGYNYQWSEKYVIGLEADFQGSGIQGSGYGNGLGLASTSNTINTVIDNGGGTVARFFNGTQAANSSVYGVKNIQAGVDWLGTVRGRLGYLLTPNMLVYGTGGLTYGSARGKIDTSSINNISTSYNYSSEDTLAPPGTETHAGSSSLSQSVVGGGQKTQTLIGWNAGGGIEWMFQQDWSLKAEAIYWNMGNMNLQTVSFVLPTASTPTISANSGQLILGNTSLNYQGIIARAGVNYHFNLGTAPTVASF